MPLLNTSTLAAFARLIALGCPPVLAAKRAGYRNMRTSRAATRLAPQPAVAPPERARAAPAAKESKATKPAEKPQAAPPEEPPLPPMLTEEEWLVKYHPKYRHQNGART